MKVFDDVRAGDVLVFNEGYAGFLTVAEHHVVHACGHAGFLEDFEDPARLQLRFLSEG